MFQSQTNEESKALTNTHLDRNTCNNIKNYFYKIIYQNIAVVWRLELLFT